MLKLFVWVCWAAKTNIGVLTCLRLSGGEGNTHMWVGAISYFKHPGAGEAQRAV